MFNGNVYWSNGSKIRKATMFSFLNKKQSGEKIRLKVDGMHCTSCSMNIDGELEDTAGVSSATTSYATGVTEIEFDKTKVSEDELKGVITKLGYTVK